MREVVTPEHVRPGPEEPLNGERLVDELAHSGARVGDVALPYV
jgi:hypothetical protein